MQPDQRRLAADAPITSATCSCPSSERGRRRSGVARHVLERQLGARDDVDAPARSSPRDVSPDRSRTAGVGVDKTTSAGSSPADRASDSAARARLRQSAATGWSGPIGAAIEVAAGVGERECGLGVEPGRALDQHRRAGSAASRSLASVKRRRARAADQQRAPAVGIEHVEQFRRRGLDRDDRDRLARPRSAPAARPQRGDRPPDGAALAQISISQISGTWSDGRSQRAAGLEHAVAGDMRAELGRGPHMVEPAAAVVPGPVGRAIAPPGEAALGRGDELAADIDPAVRLLQPAQRLDLDRRVADDVEQRLVAPDVAFERRDVEVADDDGRLAQAFRTSASCAR